MQKYTFFHMVPPYIFLKNIIFSYDLTLYSFTGTKCKFFHMVPLIFLLKNMNFCIWLPTLVFFLKNINFFIWFPLIFFEKYNFLIWSPLIFFDKIQIASYIVFLIFGRKNMHMIHWKLYRIWRTKFHKGYLMNFHFCIIWIVLDLSYENLPPDNHLGFREKVPEGGGDNCSYWTYFFQKNFATFGGIYFLFHLPPPPQK